MFSARLWPGIRASAGHTPCGAESLGQGAGALFVPRQLLRKGRCVVTTGDGKGVGLSLGGALVIAGIVIWILWSFWFGLAVALVGLIAFGGFVRGRWY